MAHSDVFYRSEHEFKKILIAVRMRLKQHQIKGLFRMIPTHVEGWAPAWPRQVHSLHPPSSKAPQCCPTPVPPSNGRPPPCQPSCLGHTLALLNTPPLRDPLRPPSMLPPTCNACMLTGGAGVLSDKQRTCICSLVLACGRLSCQAKGRGEDSESGGLGLGSELAD